MAQQDASTKRAYVSCWNNCVPHDLIVITASFLWCFRVMVFIYSEISWESELHTEELNPFMHCSVSVKKARWQKSQLLIGIVWLLHKGPCSHSFQRSTEVHGWYKCSEMCQSLLWLPEFRAKPAIIAVPMKMMYHCNLQVLKLVKLLIKFFPTFESVLG